MQLEDDDMLDFSEQIFIQEQREDNLLDLSGIYGEIYCSLHRNNKVIRVCTEQECVMRQNNYMLCGKCVLDHKSHSFKLVNLETFVRDSNESYRIFQESQKKYQCQKQNLVKENKGLKDLLQKLGVDIKESMGDYVDEMICLFLKEFDLKSFSQQIEQQIFNDNIHLKSLKGSYLGDLSQLDVSVILNSLWSDQKEKVSDHYEKNNWRLFREIQDRVHSLTKGIKQNVHLEFQKMILVLNQWVQELNLQKQDLMEQQKVLVQKDLQSLKNNLEQKQKEYDQKSSQIKHFTVLLDEVILNQKKEEPKQVGGGGGGPSSPSTTNQATNNQNHEFWGNLNSEQIENRLAEFQHQKFEIQSRILELKGPCEKYMRKQENFIKSLGGVGQFRLNTWQTDEKGFKRVVNGGGNGAESQFLQQQNTQILNTLQFISPVKSLGNSVNIAAKTGRSYSTAGGGGGGYTSYGQISQRQVQSAQSKTYRNESLIQQNTSRGVTRSHNNSTLCSGSQNCKKRSENILDEIKKTQLVQQNKQTLKMQLLQVENQILELEKAKVTQIEKQNQIFFAKAHQNINIQTQRQTQPNFFQQTDENQIMQNTIHSVTRPQSQMATKKKQSNHSLTENIQNQQLVEYYTKLIAEFENQQEETQKEIQQIQNTIQKKKSVLYKI